MEILNNHHSIFTQGHWVKNSYTRLGYGTILKCVNNLSFEDYILPSNGLPTSNANLCVVTQGTSRYTGTAVNVY